MQRAREAVRKEKRKELRRQKVGADSKGKDKEKEMKGKVNVVEEERRQEEGWERRSGRCPLERLLKSAHLSLPIAPLAVTLGSGIPSCLGESPTPGRAGLFPPASHQPL